MNVDVNFLMPYADVVYVYLASGARALPGPIAVEFLSCLGNRSQAGAKALLHRMCEINLSSMERFGRVGVYRPSDELMEQAMTFNEMAAQDRPQWAGRFHVIVYDIPESERPVRERLRGEAFRVGYAALRPGVLISTMDHSAGIPSLEEVRRNHFLADAWAKMDLDTSRTAVQRAWRMEEWIAQYREQIAMCTEVLGEPLPSGPAAIRTLHAVAMAAIPLRVRNAALPSELIPDECSMDGYLEAYRAAVSRLIPAAREHAQQVISASPYRELVTPLSGRPIVV